MIATPGAEILVGSPSRHRRRIILGWGALALGIASADAAGQAIPEPIDKGTVPVRLEPIATGLTAPVWGTHAPGDTGHLYVADQDGRLWRIDLATGGRTLFLDLSSRLVSLGVAGPGSRDERGFLGFAFHPAYALNGLLYTYTSEPVQAQADFVTLPAGATANHQSLVTEWRVTDPADPLAVVSPLSSREVLRIDQPRANHNGGAIDFGPDGYLYIALGDGGGADDPDGNGQDLSSPLGALLRIDPQESGSGNGGYGVPADNPFVGDPTALDEIYAYGLRNPFRFSFDALTGDLWLADVGQNAIEEVDRVAVGGNYGWNLKEGSFLFDANGAGPGLVTEQVAVPGLIDPVAEYDHDEGSAVIGGFVHRGSAMPSLNGRYVFGDSFHGASGGGRLFYLEGAVIRELLLEGQDTFGLVLLGFGRDAAGEVYALGNSTGTPFEDTGVVLRLAQPTSYALASGSLAVPGVRVTTAAGERFYSAELRRIADAPGLAFELAHARSIGGPLPEGSPFGDEATGVFNLPRVEVIVGPGDIRPYTATLRRVPGAVPLRLQVADAQALAP
jgi:glucose/arabinose dehydrogenase